MKKKSIAITFVIIVGLVLAVLILSQDKNKSVRLEKRHGSPATQDTSADASSDASSPNKNISINLPTKGPKGGKLFTENGFGVEATIFEQGVPPQFRLYLYKNGRPLAPNEANLKLTVSRLGAPPQTFQFVPEADYLLGNHIVDEPHSFDVAITADYNGKRYHWRYSQIEARIEMPDALLKSSGVEIATAGPAIIKPTIKLPGEITFNDEKLVHVVPRVSGVVVAVPADLGQSVKQGEILAVIESLALAELRSEWLAARKRLALARTVLEREKTLWEEKISAQQDYLSAQQAFSEAEITVDLITDKLRALGATPEKMRQNKGASNSARFEIRSPLSGIIVNKHLTKGETVKEDTAIFSVADLSTVWANLTVYPNDFNLIQKGQEAIVKATSFEAKETGHVSYIGALIGEQTRTAQARVILNNPKGVWRPGMFVSVELVAEQVKVPVAVRVDALQTVRDWSVVFGRYGNYFEARPLELGRRDGQMVEVIKGLAAGDKYAAGNSFAIKADLGKTGATHDH